MKKLMLSMLATMALAAGGAAFAQDAECSAGVAWGPKPGCGDPTAPPVGAVPLPHYSPYYDPRIGYEPRFGYYDPRVYGPAVGAYPQVIRPSRRDRDGDGVRNRDDRFPDNPRRH